MTNTTEKNFIATASDMATAYKGKTAWLSGYRSQQQESFAATEFPHARVEHFKYNRLTAFDNNDFCETTNIVSSNNVDGNNHLIPELGDNETLIDRVVFVNGKYSDEFSSIKHHRITHFCNADAAQQSKILTMLEKHDVSVNPFVMLNAALTDNGILIEIDTDSSDAIVEVLTIINADAVNTTVATQVLFDIADNTKATAIGRGLSDNIEQQQAALSTIRTIANVGESSEFTHYNLQLEDSHSLHFGSTEYNLQSSSKLNAFCAATGGQLKKIDITVNHLGQHAHAGLDGLYVATDNQQVDYHTTINHPLPNGTTDENFRGIINGSAEGVFNGRIHISQDAQKTLAELSNKNLLLSEDAIIHTKPELEIYADDVICAHGATVSRIDSESLYYLLARGISKEESEIMLSFGFFNEILAGFHNEKISDYIRPILFKRFDNLARGTGE